MKRSRGEKIFQYFDVFIILLVMATVILPIVNIIAVSFSNYDAILNNRVTLVPIGFNTEAYRQILGNSTFLRSLFNTVCLTVIGAALAIVITVGVAYVLSTEFPGKKVVTYFFVITMYFSGGLIPTYVLYTNVLRLRNSYLVLILPALVNVFYIIVVRSQIETIPPSLFEAADIDGASEYRKLFSVTIPMIVPTIAAITMFFALFKWNMWYNVMIYTSNEKYWTLQYFLRVVVFDQFIAAADGTVQAEKAVPVENFRMAAIILVAAPIVCIYPFVQKYFVKGIISGAVKG